MRALSEFLVREVLPLVATAPPRNEHEDSLTQEGSELSEAQLAQVLDSPQRIMMVRYTNAAMQSLTLVDRSRSIDAFIPQSLLETYKKSKKYKNFSRFRGSIIRVEKYHYTTPARCLASDEFVKRQQSVTRASSASGHALSPVCLWIEAMEVVDDSELAVNPLPDLLDHPEIAKEIRAIRSEYDLEKRLMVRQGLAPPAETSAIQPIDDQHPILDEDCEITSDQEEALEAQEGWGPTQSQQPSDSQLINENGSVPMMPESQEEDSVMASQPLETSHFSVETESSSQDAHFQKENIRQTFVQCDDLDSDEELSHDESQDQDLQETSKADEKRMELQGDSIQVPLFTSRSEDSVDHSHEDSELESTQRLDDPNVTLDVEDSEVNLPEEPCTQAPDSPYIDGTMPDLNSGESQYLADEDLNDEWHTQPNVDTLLFDLSSQAPEDVINDDVVVDDFVPRTPPGSTEQSNTSQPRESSLPGITSGANSDAIAEPEQSPSPLPDVESKRKRFETSEAEKDSQPSNSTEERAAFDAEADVIIEPEQPPTSLSPVRESKRKRIATSDVIRPAKVSRSSNFTDERRVTFSVDNTDKQTPLNNSRQKKKSQIQDQLSSVRSRSSSAAPAPIVPAFLLAKDRVVVKMPFEFPVWRKPDTSISPLIRPSKRYADLFPPLDMERIKRMLEE